MRMTILISLSFFIGCNSSDNKIVQFDSADDIGVAKLVKSSKTNTYKLRLDYNNVLLDPVTLSISNQRNYILFDTIFNQETPKVFDWYADHLEIRLVNRKLREDEKIEVSIKFH